MLGGRPGFEGALRPIEAVIYKRKYIDFELDSARLAKVQKAANVKTEMNLSNAEKIQKTDVGCFRDRTGERCLKILCGQ